MTEDRVYFNTGLFSEENKEVLTKISILKYGIKKISYRAYNLKCEYKSLLVAKNYKSQELQEEYTNLAKKLSSSELNVAWSESRTKVNLRNKMIIVKTLIKKIQTELTTINKEIKEKNREVDVLRKQLPQ